MKRKYTTIKKILFGVVIGTVCCSMTGCAEMQKNETITKAAEESTVKRLENTTGFCGTADSLEQQLEGSILLEWYPNLSKGTYRLSFRAIKQTEEGIKEISLKDTFQYEP